MMLIQLEINKQALGRPSTTLGEKKQLAILTSISSDGTEAKLNELNTSHLCPALTMTNTSCVLQA